MPPIKLKLNLGAAAKARSTTEHVSRGASGASPDPDAASYPSTPGPSTIRLTIPSTAGATRTVSAASSTVSTPSASPFSTPGPTPSDTPKRKRGRPPKARPSAIPAHIVAEATTTLRLPSTRTRTHSPPTPVWTTPDVDVKYELDDDADPLSQPLSPAAAQVSYSHSSTPFREGSTETTSYTPRQAKWKRIKRPFKDLANKVLQEMRRKDEYGFFLEPVDTDEYPDYLARIGGRDKMMDLGTMQQKLDDGEYRGVDDLEADFRMLIAAALAFNLPGTAPVREANKLSTHGLKHLERARPLVRTPTPSPSLGTSALPDSEYGTPRPGRQPKEATRKNMIPVDMLAFPPNSLEAAAVAWNQTGGRRVRAKRFVRGREKFIGRWRDWAPDGSRDVAEMDDPADILEPWKTRLGSDWRTVTDYPKLWAEEGAWWEWDGFGGPTGQPPLPNSERIKRPVQRTRELGWEEWGVYPELKEGLGKKKGDDLSDTITEELRPASPKVEPLPAGWPQQTFANIYDGPPPVDYLRDIVLGGVRGEAYNASVSRFLDGALAGVKDKEDAQTTEAALRGYVAHKWHDGVLVSHEGELARQTVGALAVAASQPAKSEAMDVDVKPAVESKAKPTDALGLSFIPPRSPDSLLEQARETYAYLSMRALSSPRNPLNLQPLLRDPSDFMFQGVGGKSGVVEALSWVGKEITRLSAVHEAKVKTGAAKLEEASGSKRRLSDGAEDGPEAKRQKSEDGAPQQANGVKDEPIARPSTPATAVVKPEPVMPVNGTATTVASTTTPASTTAPSAPPIDDENGLRQLRLELVALSKFYPLASLRKMDRADAAKLLPANVRALMTRPGT